MLKAHLQQEIADLLKVWSFNWGVMDVLISGRSPIDLADLRFRNWYDATEFLKYYGYDPDDPRDAKVVHSVIVEAWNFIEKELMPREWQKGKRPPKKLLYAEDARDIILAASDLRPEARYLQIWACSLLRVMHTIAHINGVQRLLNSTAARDQIMQRFMSLIFRDDQGELWFGKKTLSIPIYQVEWKYEKTRESMILKLLHKTANVAETIYDMIGVRIVTHRLSDVMVVAKFLRYFHAVTFANCNPSRAKNSLIDVKAFRENFDMLRKMLENGTLGKNEFTDLLNAIARHPSSHRGVKNPHSSKNYRSIQLTCRQLIRYEDPAKAWLRKISEALVGEGLSESRRQLLGEILNLTRGYDAAHNGEDAGFFPFEVQIMDRETFQNNLMGSANHQAYKGAQIRSARRRVLGNVLTYKGPVPD